MNNWKPYSTPLNISIFTPNTTHKIRPITCCHLIIFSLLSSSTQTETLGSHHETSHLRLLQKPEQRRRCTVHISFLPALHNRSWATQVRSSPQPSTSLASLFDQDRATTLLAFITSRWCSTRTSPFMSVNHFAVEIAPLCRRTRKHEYFVPLGTTNEPKHATCAFAVLEPNTPSPCKPSRAQIDNHNRVVNHSKANKQCDASKFHRCRLSPLTTVSFWREKKWTYDVAWSIIGADCHHQNNTVNHLQLRCHYECRFAHEPNNNKHKPHTWTA